MYATLKAFYNTWGRKQALGSITKRLRFRKGFQKREKHLKILQQYSKNFERLIDLATKSKSMSTSRKHSEPTEWLQAIEKIHPLMEILYRGLSSCWKCGCHSRHVAKFCLGTIRNCVNDSSSTGNEFDILVETTNDVDEKHWCEAVVLVRQERYVLFRFKSTVSPPFRPAIITLRVISD